MTRLSVRIFLYFWLVIGVTLSITFVVNRAGSRADLERERVATLQSSLDALAAQAQGALASGGEQALRAWLVTEVAQRPEPPLLVVAPDDMELLGRALPRVPPRALEMLRRAGERTTGRPRGPFPVRVLSAPDGGRYILFVRPSDVGRGRWLADARGRQTLWFVLLVVSGAACFWLARYVTRPVRALRAAGQRIAGGDLSARVGPAMGARRDELGALAREFDRMADRVQALVGSQQQLLRDVSHELRSPLARLQAAVGLIRQRVGDSPDPDLDRIEREGERLDAMIGQILAFSRLQDRQARGQESVDLGALLAEVVADATYEARAAGKRVEVDAVSTTLTGEEAVLRSALDNLVRNAVEHAAGVVQVALTTMPDQVEIKVTDDGPGVPDAALGSLFAPFYQVPGRPGRGSGLGLAITARAVELHGGTITARPAAPGGLEVLVILPRAAAPGPPRSPAPAHPR
jgi:two-component system sensor histidine kinase CpxA